MVRVRRIGIIRTATVAAVMYAVVILFGTLVIGLPFALLAGAASRSVDASLGIGAIGVAGVLIFGLVGALFYAVVGWIMTALGCAVYNLVAGWVGGIEVQLESLTPAQAPAWGGPYGQQQGYGQQPAYPPQGPGGTQPPPPGWGGQR
jgi:hypothetical protein